MKSGELSTKKLHEVLAEKLEDLILHGIYAPGDMLPSARELAVQYGVSQTVVRDATRSLAGKGLVRVQQGVGTSVAQDVHSGLIEAFRWTLRQRQVTRSELDELAGVLEIQTAPLAAQRRTAEDITQMQDILNEYESLAATGSGEQLGSCHRRFHTALIDATHNRAVTAIVAPLLELILGDSEPVHAGEAAARSYQQHARILACIREGNTQAARMTVAEYYQVPSLSAC